MRRTEHMIEVPHLDGAATASTGPALSIRDRLTALFDNVVYKVDNISGEVDSFHKNNRQVSLFRAALEGARATDWASFERELTDAAHFVYYRFRGDEKQQACQNLAVAAEEVSRSIEGPKPSSTILSKMVNHALADHLQRKADILYGYRDFAEALAVHGTLARAEGGTINHESFIAIKEVFSHFIYDRAPGMELSQLAAESVRVVQSDSFLRDSWGITSANEGSYLLAVQDSLVAAAKDFASVFEKDFENVIAGPFEKAVELHRLKMDKEAEAEKSYAAHQTELAPVKDLVLNHGFIGLSEPKKIASILNSPVSEKSLEKLLHNGEEIINNPRNWEAFGLHKVLPIDVHSVLAKVEMLTYEWGSAVWGAARALNRTAELDGLQEPVEPVATSSSTVYSEEAPSTSIEQPAIVELERIGKPEALSINTESFAKTILGNTFENLMSSMGSIYDYFWAKSLSREEGFISDCRSVLRTYIVKPEAGFSKQEQEHLVEKWNEVSAAKLNERASKQEGSGSVKGLDDLSPPVSPSRSVATEVSDKIKEFFFPGGGHIVDAGLKDKDAVISSIVEKMKDLREKFGLKVSEFKSMAESIINNSQNWKDGGFDFTEPVGGVSALLKEKGKETWAEIAARMKTLAELVERAAELVEGRVEAKTLPRRPGIAAALKEVEDTAVEATPVEEASRGRIGFQSWSDLREKLFRKR
jgi:hypothetical protein